MNIHFLLFLFFLFKILLDICFIYISNVNPFPHYPTEKPLSQNFLLYLFNTETQILSQIL